ncbi:hypothetical protein [Streptomyces sp. NPDC003015]
MCAAVVASVILLWPTPDAAAAAPTSDQIKASAQARLDASLSAGRAARQQIQAAGKTPDDAMRPATWDNQTATERRGLRYAMWMHGCADTPE